MIHLTAADQAFLLLLIICVLGPCFVRVFWQLEQVRSRRIMPRVRRDRR
jgi:hypothetical protein